MAQHLNTRCGSNVVSTSLKTVVLLAIMGAVSVLGQDLELEADEIAMPSASGIVLGGNARRAMPFAKVTLWNREFSRQIAITKTNEEGRFVFPGKRVGAFGIEVSAEGWNIRRVPLKLDPKSKKTKAGLVVVLNPST